MKRCSPVLLLAFCLVACRRPSGLREDLARVESFIQERPDSALVTLEAMDRPALSGERERAKFSLLYAMALDKNYIDTTDTGIIQPAVDYYAKRGTADERLKAWYQLANIQANRGDLNAAAISYSEAEAWIDIATDEKYKGLLCDAFSVLYDKIYNIDREQEYIEKALAHYREAGAERHYRIALVNKVHVYQKRREWGKADSLFQVCLPLCAEDTLAMRDLLSSYARVKMFAEEEDPAGAVSLLDRKQQEYKIPLSLDDYGVYAWASALNGDDATCDKILRWLDSQDLDASERVAADYWECQIAEYRKDYPRAFALLQNSYAGQDTLVLRLLNHSVTESLKDHFAAEAKRSREKARTNTLALALAAALVLLLSMLAVVLLSRKRRMERERAEQLLRLSEETNRLLGEEGARSEKELSALKSSFANIYKEKFFAVKDLCNTWLLAENRTDKQELIYRKVRDQIALLVGDDNLHARLEAEIDRDLDNIVSHLREDLPELGPKDVLFVCYCIVGLDPETIAVLLGLSLSNVYTKKSRIKEKIRHLDSPYKEDYLRML